MNAKVADLMRPSVMTTTAHQTLGHIREVMQRNKVSSIPVISPDGKPIGIVTSTDFLKDQKANTPVGSIMKRKVYTIPKYADVSIAARLMRNHHLHHVVVTHEKKIVGILSSFDLLRLVEDHRFVPKNPPTGSKPRGIRNKAEYPDGNHA